MINLTLTNTIKTGFAAMNLHLAADGVVWARLMNGKLATCNTHNKVVWISDYRIMENEWKGDKAIYSRDWHYLYEYDLKTRNERLIAEIPDASGPIRLLPDGTIVAAGTRQICSVKQDGSYQPLTRVDFDVYSLQIVKDVLWIGGVGLVTYNLKTGKQSVLQEGLEWAILDIASSMDNRWVATGSSTLELYYDGVLRESLGTSLVRCHFNKSNVLFTRTQEKRFEGPLRWDIVDVAGIETCIFNNCNCFLCVGEVGSEQIIVSHETSLYFFDCSYE